MEGFQRAVGWCETAGRHREGRFGAAGITRGPADELVNKGGTAEGDSFRPLLYQQGRKAFLVGKGFWTTPLWRLPFWQGEPPAVETGKAVRRVKGRCPLREV